MLGCTGKGRTLQWGCNLDSTGILGICSGMESGDFAHKPLEPSGGMVSTGKPYTRPLLPYERQLIDLLGCSVEEYQFFVREVERRSGVRPAAYDHIPDIQCTGGEVAFLVSLAIGLIFTGVSYLLTPKPRMPSLPPFIADRGGGGGGGSRVLGSRAGSERFAQTSGFDSIAQLAEYGESIPIIWTKYVLRNDGQSSTGGVVITPKLIWSRLFSQATHQAAKMLFVVGETGVQYPDLSGIFVGNNSLDIFGDNSYAFWWRNAGRVDRSNLLYGTQSGPGTGDAHQNPELFASGYGPDNFCQALSPSNNVEFGVSNGMPNGTQYKLNYKITSIPVDLKKKGNLRRDLAKVCGYYLEPNGEILYRNGGLGFGYFRRQGISSFTSKGTTNVSVGTTLNYVISGNKTERFLFGGADDDAGGGDLTDVNNTLDSECAATDDILQLGETVIINHSVWRVINRSLPVWRIGETQTITLECIEVLDSSEVRHLSEEQVTTEAGHINQHTNNPPQTQRAGDVYDNLCRVSFAAFKNTRPVRITQIGLQSQVWGKFSGLCNFNTLLTGGQVSKLNAENVQVQSGTMTDYFTRTSAFTLYYREIGSTSWIKTGLLFCVRGSSPVSQFHQLTIEHGERRSLEFRFVPYTAARLYRLPLTQKLYWLTSGVSGQRLSANGITVFGFFSEISIEECAQLDQMFAPSDKGEKLPDRNFSFTTGIAEISAYGSVIARSCDSGSEHRIAYVNEIKEPFANIPPTFTNLTTAALSIRSNRNLSGLDQVRLWIGSGVNNSNSFPDLVQYLLENTDQINPIMINTGRFAEAKSFCEQRGLYFDGAVSEKANIREYISNIAPFFLLNFVIANGKFALMPAIPYDNVPVTNFFTAGNIIDDSFSVEYLPADQRRDFQAVMTYRTHQAKNEFPVLHTYRARFADVPSSAPIEAFDMSAFCTSRSHAEQAARYFLSIRRRVTHLIRFKTASEQARVIPGQYIKVAIEQNVVSSTGNGVISASNGAVTGSRPLADGTYSITYYQPGNEDLRTGTLAVSNGIATDTSLWGALFAESSSSVNTSTYLVEQVEIDEDGLVNVVATEFPVEAILSDMEGNGIITEDV